MSVKRKVNVKSLGKKCQTLKDLESGLSNTKVAKKYGAPRNTISTWTKNKTCYLLHWSNLRLKRKS